MKTLLYFIADYCMDLLYIHEFKFVNSIAAETRSDGRITLSNGKVNFIFCQDRGIDSLDVGRTGSNNFYSQDILYEYLRGRIADNGYLDQAAGEFLQNNMDSILNIFQSDDYAEATKKLDALVDIRTTRMWG